MQAAASNVKRVWTQPVQFGSLGVGSTVPRQTDETHEQSTTVECFLCEVCGDVIGVYEPLVMHTIASKRATSRAAKPELRVHDGAYFHRECHAAAAD